jgi:hypothetical protein
METRFFVDIANITLSFSSSFFILFYLLSYALIKTHPFTIVSLSIRYRKPHDASWNPHYCSSSPGQPCFHDNPLVYALSAYDDRRVGRDPGLAFRCGVCSRCQGFGFVQAVFRPCFDMYSCGFRQVFWRQKLMIL